MDVVLVGLPGSGKSVVGRRLAKNHAATFIDLDERIETTAGRSIPEVFADDGEAAFRDLERAAIADLGPADGARDVRRVIATGGGAVVDPRNRTFARSSRDGTQSARSATSPRNGSASMPRRRSASSASARSGASSTPSNSSWRPVTRHRQAGPCCCAPRPRSDGSC
jgi:hypothetical protein